MKSTEIPGIGAWNKWGEAAVRTAPTKPGVYVFRLDKTVQRLKCQSDVMYIGTTRKGKSSIKKRLRQHSREEGITGRSLRRITNEVGELEVAWVSFPDHKRAQWFESELLAHYIAEHIELPPVNRQESGVKVRRILELVQELSPEEQEKFFAQAQSRMQAAVTKSETVRQPVKNVINGS